MSVGQLIDFAQGSEAEAERNPHQSGRSWLKLVRDSGQISLVSAFRSYVQHCAMHADLKGRTQRPIM